MANLNIILDYNLIGQRPKISAATQLKVDQHVIINNRCWGSSKSYMSDFYKETKTYYAGKQRTRCAYCRTTINIKGSGNAIEHITARDNKPNWMFVLHNLVVSCDNCNSSKGTKDVLVKGHNTFGNLPANCPDDSESYYLFNPHRDKWSDHFEIEDGYFLKPKPNTKGPFTYKELGMNRDLIVIDYMRQNQVREPYSIRILNKRIKNEKDTKKLEILKSALEHFKNLIDNS